MEKHQELDEWIRQFEPTDEDMAEIGLDEEELSLLKQRAEQPELECFDVVHAKQPKTRWSR